MEVNMKHKTWWVNFLSFCEAFSIIIAVPPLLSSEVGVGQSAYSMAFVVLAIYFHLIAKEHRKEIKEYKKMQAEN